MLLLPARFSTRAVSLLMLAAFAGIALWLFQPWSRASSESHGGRGGPPPPSLKVDGQVQVQTQGDVVTGLVVPITVRGSKGVAIPDDGKMRAETSLSQTAAAAVPAAYTVKWLDGDGDHVLDLGEHAELIVTLPPHTSVHPANPLRLVLRTPDGGTLAIEDVLD